jgi:hypothetical protein
MDAQSFRQSLDAAEPPQGLSHAGSALWWDAKGDWDKAHKCAQQQENDTEGCWVHAYLHRVEGDLENAGYWYRRAGKPASAAPLAEEWQTLVEAIVAHP